MHPKQKVFNNYLFYFILARFFINYSLILDTVKEFMFYPSILLGYISFDYFTDCLSFINYVPIEILTWRYEVNLNFFSVSVWILRTHIQLLMALHNHL